MLVAIGFAVSSHSSDAELLARFQAGSGGWQLGTVGVGNLDDDPALEIVVPYRDGTGSWFLDAFNPDGTRLPGFPYASVRTRLLRCARMERFFGHPRLRLRIMFHKAVIKP